MSTPDEVLTRCRSFGHAWDDFTPIDKRPPPFGWRLSLRCVRCTTERHDIIDRLGRVASREYVYPDGYAQTGRRPRTEWRRDLRRVIQPAARPARLNRA